MSTEFKDEVLKTLVAAKALLNDLRDDYSNDDHIYVGEKFVTTQDAIDAVIEQIDVVQTLALKKVERPETQNIHSLSGVLTAIRIREPQIPYDDPAYNDATSVVTITESEREQICMGFGIMMMALRPFGTLATPDSYPDTAAVNVEVQASREMAQKYVDMWDQRAAAGDKPVWARPDIERGLNIPTQILNVDGLDMADIRYAKEVMTAMGAEWFEPMK